MIYDETNRTIIQSERVNIPFAQLIADPGLKAAIARQVEKHGVIVYAKPRRFTKSKKFLSAIERRSDHKK